MHTAQCKSCESWGYVRMNVLSTGEKYYNMKESKSNKEAQQKSKHEEYVYMCLWPTTIMFCVHCPLSHQGGPSQIHTWCPTPHYPTLKTMTLTFMTLMTLILILNTGKTDLEDNY
jgi:hypothetical protein